MFEDLGLGISPLQASLILGLGLGLVFGVLGQISGFCIRRAISGGQSDRAEAQAVWLSALASALIGTQILIGAGLISFDDHRFFAADLPWVAIISGGLLFGAGMILTRGCVSRLTVLSGSGNLRAFIVLLIFAVIAHATQKGILSPVRVWLGSFTTDLGSTTSLIHLPGGGVLWTILLVAVISLKIFSGNARYSHLLMGAVIGLLIPIGWVATGYLLYDEFDPILMQSLSFTLPASDTLFWVIASTSIPAGFGAGLIGGVIGGSAATHIWRKQFRWQGFDSPAQTLRYLGGAAMMGVGGVLAGGCTVGAGISGVATLSIAALIALVSMVTGGVVTNQLLTRSSGSAQPVHTRAVSTPV